MASATKKLKLIRKRKKTKRGQTRKRLARTKGTTQPASELFGDK